VVAVLGAAHLNGVQARLLEGGGDSILQAWETMEMDARVTTPNQA
jgi:hypothetical protein